MQLLEVSGAVRPIHGSLGVKRLTIIHQPGFLSGGEKKYFEKGRNEFKKELHQLKA